MTIQEIFDLYNVDAGTFDKLLGILAKDQYVRTIPEWQEQFDGKHKILDRPGKTVGKEGKEVPVDQAKEVITLQKKITNFAVAFLFGDPPKLIMNDGDDKAFKLLTDVWKRCKLDYFNKKIARKVFIETKAAELWYVIKGKDEPSIIKVSLLCKKNGDEIFAHFDDYGDMDAFLRQYTLMNVQGKAVDHADIYTAEQIVHGVKGSGGWLVETEANLFGKIPVIYYSQEKPEWDDVQTEIDRIEMAVSKFADTNDYFGSPILKYMGDEKDFPAKEEVGKVLRFSGVSDDKGIITYPGDAEYLTWEQAPEAIELEYKMLKDIIFSMTSTPDLSFENVKGVGNISGIALKLMFLDSIFKAKDKEELFGENLTRRVNLLKAILSITDSGSATKLTELDVSIEFGSILPTDVKELIESLSVARGGEPIMSKETAVSQNPLVLDATADIESMEQEQEKSSKLGESYEV